MITFAPGVRIFTPTAPVGYAENPSTVRKTPKGEIVLPIGWVSIWPDAAKEGDYYTWGSRGAWAPVDHRHDGGVWKYPAEDQHDSILVIRRLHELEQHNYVEHGL